MTEDRTETGGARLVKLSDSNLTLAEPTADARGRKVLDRQGDEIGHVDDLFVDEGEGKVRFLRVAAGGFLSLGERHFLVPVDAVTRTDPDTVQVDQTLKHVTGSPAYDPALVDRPDYWSGYYGYYGYAPFWGPGYVYPGYPYY